jgi:hypothetical protein
MSFARSWCMTQTRPDRLHRTGTRVAFA